MKTTDVKISELIEADYNPRSLTKKQFNSIKESIEKFGFVEPIVVNENKNRKNIIVGGHQRLQVAQSLGYDTIPVYYVNLELDDERELNIRLNANVGDWDWDKIANEWSYSDLENWGLKIPITDFSSELFDVDESQIDENIKDSQVVPSASGPQLQIPMSEESKDAVMSVLNYIKIEQEVETNEEALLYMCLKFREAININEQS